MLEAEYEHECCRAELLGLPRPTWDEFLTQRKANQEGENRDDMEEEQIHEEMVTARREEVRFLPKKPKFRFSNYIFTKYYYRVRPPDLRV